VPLVYSKGWQTWPIEESLAGKTPASCKISLKCQIQLDKECKFYINKKLHQIAQSPWQLILRNRVNTLIKEANVKYKATNRYIAINLSYCYSARRATQNMWASQFANCWYMEYSYYSENLN